MRPHTAVLAVLLALPASAQTDAIAYEPANALYQAATWVAHENAQGFHVFSAFSQRFDRIANGNAVLVHGTDHGLLYLEGTDYWGYSALRNERAQAPLANDTSIAGSDARENVFYLWTITTEGVHRVHGYSALTNTWRQTTLGLGPREVDIVISDQAIGVRHNPTGPGALHSIAAFGSREGDWDEVFDLQEVDHFQAVGNVVAAAVTDNFMPRFFAFTAVHNVHALSECQFELDSLRVAHNVAVAKTFDGASSWRGSAFSAYDGTWVPSDRLRPLAEDAGILLGDNWAALHDGDALDAADWEAIGARPHDRWVRLQARAGLVYQASDALVLDDRGGRLVAFSGLAGSAWHARTATAPYDPDLGPDHLCAIADADDVVHAFSPMHDAWADPLVAPAVRTSHSREALTSVLGPGSPVQAYAARWNEWVQGPVLGSFASTPYAEHLLYWYDDRAGELLIFDGRKNAFVGPIATGPELYAFGHHLLVVDGGAVSGYSTHRGVWETYAKPGGPIAFPLDQGPLVRQSVASLVDGDGDLVAIGATNDVEILHDYPEGSEYHALAEAGAAVSSTPVTLSIRGVAGDRVRTYYADRRRFIPLNLPMAFTGKGWLRHPVVRLDNHLFVGSEREHHLVIGLPPGSPGNIHVWTQTLNDTAAGVPTRFVAGVAPEPLWIF